MVPLQAQVEEGKYGGRGQGLATQTCLEPLVGF